MKYYVLILAITLLFGACKKKVAYESGKARLAKKNSGFVFADLNGKRWQEDLIVRASYVRSDHGKFYISIYTFKGENWDASFNIATIDLNKKTNRIRPITLQDKKDPYPCYGTFQNVVGSDVSINDYKVLDDSTLYNQIEIEEYNKESNTVRGTFQLVLYKTFGDTAPGYSDTLRFTNGKFTLKINSDNS